MTLIEAPRHATRDGSDAEALIKEARQRQRKRHLLVGIVVLMAIIVGGVIYAIVSRPSARARPTRTSSPTKTVSVAQSGSYVSPKAPYSLAVTPNGDLLVVDSGRDQILRRLPSGKFQVLAGDGKRGFAGDGGLAVRAEVYVQNDSGIAVARDGTVYFSDTGNGRVREVLSNGIIKTVVGGGTRALGQGSMPALSASINKQFILAGLTIGPNGELYVAANAVYRLGSHGILHWVVGRSVPMPNYCWDCNPGNQNDFLGAERLAFDGKGDLLVAGGPGWGLYEMTKSGKLLFLENFRGDGFWGSLAEVPGGTVLLAVRNGFLLFSPSRSIKSVGPSESAIDSALGKMNKEPRQNIFIGGDGVAVSKHGDIYVDTNVGNTFTSVSAILELRPNGSVVALWKS
jgi:hypothetical protein